MESKHKEILKQMSEQFLNDLDVNNGIISPLTSEYVLKEEDLDSIKKGNSRREKAKILLDLLPKRGSRAFEVFHQSLKNHYSWFSDDIDKLLQASASRTCLNDPPFIYNMQPVSPLTVSREGMIKKLKSSLQILCPNGYLVLHGMKGFGKSCLTASTLKDKDFIFNLFHNEVYWIKFGYKRNVNEEILIQLNNLNQQIKNLNCSLNSENLEPLEKDLKKTIENYFRDSVHQKALLILDDVCHEEIVNQFDFECKTLVITADIGVLGNRNHSIVKIDHGFTEKETLSLFAKVLDVSVDELPIEAKHIHDGCKGMPLLIAMFAAQFENFKHDMKNSKGRWQYYLQCLRTKDAKNKVIEEFMKIQEATFDVCIDQLKDDMKKRYENLVIFNEDVNIMPKTLEILWEEKPFFVDEIMLDFCHKSLAAKKWNDDLRTYVYGVHDLLLSHLRSKLKPGELKAKHISLIEKYRKYCDGDFSKLPNDNYSLSYIGHHLEQAGLFEEFNSLYMNFDFLQAKLNTTGLSDLLIDLKKYRKYITNNGNKFIESDLQALEKFLETHANTLAKHRLMKCLDLIQIALNNPDEDFVKNTAQKLALSRNSSLYLVCQFNLRNNPYLNFCEEIIKNATTTVFTNDPNLILAGSINGEIILWDCENRQYKIFRGHNKEKAIKKIVLSINGDFFLALSEDGTLKLYALNENEFISDELSVQSPIHKQIFWQELFDTAHDDSLKTLDVPNEFITDMKFSQVNNKIAACTNKGTVVLWDINGNLKWNDKNKSHRYGGVSFSTKDCLLHVMDETKSVIRIYKNQGNRDCYEYISQFNLQLENPSVIYFSKHPEEDNCLVIVTDRVALYFKWFKQNNFLHSFEKMIKIEEKDKNIHYIAATLTYDARYLIIGDSRGTISVMKAFNPDDKITQLKGYVTSLDSYWIYYEGFHLICGSERRQINRWQIKDDEKPKSVSKLLFDAKMENFDGENTVALKSFPNKITIYEGKKIITKIESDNGRIERLKLYNNAKELIYITESGFIVLYNLDTGDSINIFKLSSIDSFIDILQIQNNFIFVCKGENDELQVWRNTKVSQTFENSKKIIFIKKMRESCVLTISSDGKIKFWTIENLEWREGDQYPIKSNTITHCCLSKSKRFLAVVDQEKKLIIFKIFYDEEKFFDKTEPFYDTCEYKETIKFCEFSEDDKYLAVALDNGDISIINVSDQEVLGRLYLHGCAINELHWSPVSIKTPILLSVNGDELAWWNVTFLKPNNKNHNRRSRMGFDRRSNEGLSPRSSLNLPYNQNLENLDNKNSTFTQNLEEYWKIKLPKNPDTTRAALLGCVQLPSSCTGQIRVCVSDDFSKFLTVDIHGAIINYTLFHN